MRLFQEKIGCECFQSERDIEAAAVELRHDLRGEMALHLFHVNGVHMRLAHTSSTIQESIRINVYNSREGTFSGILYNIDEWWCLRRLVLEMRERR